MKEFVEKLLNELNYQKEHYKKVHEADKRTEHETDLYKVLQNTYDSAIRIVKRVAGEYLDVKNSLTSSGWIPVEKGLPEEKEVKIVGDIVTNSEIVWIALENMEEMHAYLEDGRWYSIGGELIREKVVAWHPAYKPEKYSIFKRRQQSKNV